MDYSDKIKSALFGIAIGDSLGVPVEFMSRKEISNNPVTDMIGYGTYNLPAGTWSDDSEGKDKFEIYNTLKTEIPEYLLSVQVRSSEISRFNRLLNQNIYELDEEEISGNGYVLHTLESGIWCLLTTNNFKDAVLKAVNLGEDTDTTAAVTGGLAGLLYGYDSIPTEWIDKLARKDDIEELAERVAARIEK